MKDRRLNILIFILLMIMHTACHNNGGNHATEEDTINVLNTVLKSSTLDSVIKPYHDSTMVIIRDKFYMRKEFPLFWQNRKVHYIEKSAEVLEYDTSGNLQKFYVTFGIPKMNKDSAEVSFGFRYYGASILWKLIKKEEGWAICNTKVGLQ